MCRLGIGTMLAVMMATSAAWAAPMALAITGASVAMDAFSGKPTLQIELAPDAQRAFTKLTTRHVNAVVNLIIDGKVVSSPRVMTPIVGSSVVISGDFTASELKALAQRLTAGDAVVAVELAEE